MAFHSPHKYIKEYTTSGYYIHIKLLTIVCFYPEVNYDITTPKNNNLDSISSNYFSATIKKIDENTNCYFQYSCLFNNSVNLLNSCIWALIDHYKEADTYTSKNYSNHGKLSLFLHIKLKYIVFIFKKDLNKIVFVVLKNINFDGVPFGFKKKTLKGGF